MFTTDLFIKWVDESNNLLTQDRPDKYYLFRQQQNIWKKFSAEHRTKIKEWLLL